jgi:hypothetical protein
MMTVQDYKKRVSSRFIATDATLMAQTIVEADYYYASIKYDGHLGLLNISKGKASLTGVDGKERNIPVILKAAESFKDDILLAGEICVFKDGKSLSHREVSAAIAKPEKYDIRFAVFDICSHKGKEIDLTVKEKQELIEKLIPKGTHIFAVEQSLFESRSDLFSFYENAISAKEEGVVIRSALNMVYKVKPIISLDLAIVGYALNADGNFRDFLLAYCTAENEFQLMGVTGSGLSEQQKQQWIKRLEPMGVESEYTEVSRAKTAYRMVRPEIVIEINCLDLLNESGNQATMKMQLNYDPKKGYLIEGQKPGLSFIAAVIKCEREDKKPTVQDCGSRQFEHILMPLELSAAQTVNITSEIVKREAYFKSAKGATAVRKFVLLKTNKEHLGNFSPYVLLFTDYSAGRKTPLEQEIFIFEKQKSAEEKFEALVTENVKKGWEKS